MRKPVSRNRGFTECRRGRHHGRPRRSARRTAPVKAELAKRIVARPEWENHNPPTCASISTFFAPFKRRLGTRTPVFCTAAFMVYLAHFLRTGGVVRHADLVHAPTIRSIAHDPMNRPRGIMHRTHLGSDLVSCTMPSGLNRLSLL
jgi:hypothetical protein